MDDKEIFKGINDFMSQSDFTQDEAASLYTIFLKEIKDDLEAFAGAVSKNNYKDAADIIHNIKGISANYHISDVFRSAEFLDQMFKKNSQNELEYYVDLLIKQMEFAEEKILEFFHRKGIQL